MCYVVGMSLLHSTSFEQYDNTMFFKFQSMGGECLCPKIGPFQNGEKGIFHDLF
jgi:hypothetical protein